MYSKIEISLEKKVHEQKKLQLLRILPELRFPSTKRKYYINLRGKETYALIEQSFNQSWIEFFFFILLLNLNSILGITISVTFGATASWAHRATITISYIHIK